LEISIFWVIPYGHGGPNEQHSTILELEVYMANALRLSFKAICSTPHISPNSIWYACSQPCSHLCLCSLQSPPYQCCTSNHYKSRESCSSSLNHYPLTYIKFITICLYLLSHLITFDRGVTYDQLLCVVQLSWCLSDMFPLKSTNAFACTAYQWPCICIARWDLCLTQKLLGFQ